MRKLKFRVGVKSPRNSNCLTESGRGCSQSRNRNRGRKTAAEIKPGKQVKKSGHPTRRRGFLHQMWATRSKKSHRLEMRAHLNTHRACAADGSTVGPLTVHFSSHSLQLVSVYMWVLVWKPAFPSARGKRDWERFPCLDTYIPRPPPHSPDILLLECQAFQGCLISFAEGSTFPCLHLTCPPPPEHKLPWHTSQITTWVMRPRWKAESVTVSRSIPNPQARSPRRQAKNVPCGI